MAAVTRFLWIDPVSSDRVLSDIPWPSILGWLERVMAPPTGTARSESGSSGPTKGDAFGLPVCHPQHRMPPRKTLEQGV